jgi:hypothetical protein
MLGSADPGWSEGDGVGAGGDPSGGLGQGGRLPYTRRQLDYVLAMVGKETSSSAIAKAIGLSRQTVLRIKADPGKAHRVAELWGNR